MPKKEKDPTTPIRKQASEYPEVDEGTACTQSSFKARKKGFLFVGMQGGRYKAMFKLKESLPVAAKLAQEQPGQFEVGSGGWVTARFTAEDPMPKKLWSKWLDEGYALCLGAAPKRTSVRKSTSKKVVSKKATKPR